MRWIERQLTSPERDPTLVQVRSHRALPEGNVIPDGEGAGAGAGAGDEEHQPS